MKVSLDRTKCSGIGLCEMFAEAVFRVGDDGQGGVIDENPPESQRSAIEEAVASCPTSAVSVEN
ncbi:ferredoxin [Mycolicibacterium sp.]|uniref:ferredoxin n=1 Tax=Mycolicibacterium sp. TaxID=2320850 RepID=UPI003D0CA52E